MGAAASQPFQNGSVERDILITVNDKDSYSFCKPSRLQIATVSIVVCVTIMLL